MAACFYTLWSELTDLPALFLFSAKRYYEKISYREKAWKLIQDNDRVIKIFAYACVAANFLHRSFNVDLTNFKHNFPYERIICGALDTLLLNDQWKQWKQYQCLARLSMCSAKKITRSISKGVIERKETLAQQQSFCIVIPSTFSTNTSNMCNLWSFFVVVVLFWSSVIASTLFIYTVHQSRHDFHVIKLNYC